MKKACITFLIAVLCLVIPAGCTPAGGNDNNGGSNSSKIDDSAPSIEGLTYESTLELEYAKCFKVYRYEGGYAAIRIDDGNDYLLVPEGGKIPENLPSNCTVLQQPLDRVYLVATSVMSMVDDIDAMDNIRLSGTKADGWYVQSAIDRMNSGEILYAGKYSAPDYETLVAEKCNLSIQSTMILHTPEVQEKLEEMGIPVFIERAFYEDHPLGRTEWIKLYGELFNKQEEAAKAFDEQKAYLDELEDFENTGKTVAFFYVNQNGTIVTRKTDDYIPTMIELAGGKYIFENLTNDSGSSGVNLTMEEFYATAKDADYIVYNATIDDPLNSLDDLLQKSNLFADFKAVKNGNVWSTDKYLYQAANENGAIIKDFNTMLVDDSVEKLNFMYKLH